MSDMRDFNSVSEDIRSDEDLSSGENFSRIGQF